ncbi:MAG: LPXTG cell wall anchor domain-containing protein [Umezawaea sp.]
MARRVLGAITATATAGLALMAFAMPASAHTPTSGAKCVVDKAVLSVKLAYYAQNGNKIVVKDGGTELVNTSFGSSYEKSWTLPGDVDHTFTIDVKASDGATHNYSKTHTVKACVTPPTTTTKPSVPSTPPSTTTPPSTPPSSDVSTPESTPETTTTAPVGAGGAEATPPLAATGASPGWLLLSGLGLVGAGAVALVVVRRKRA